MIVQPEYRKSTSASIMLPLLKPSEEMDDTVCPNCRHVLTIPTTTSHLETNTATTTITLPKLNLADLDDSIEQLLLENSELRPPTPPPRLKPTTYANIPSGSTSKPMTKSYVTMSNINLNTNQSPNFVPVTSPKARVYRQLSGGGLVTNNSYDLKIHELQPRHQMCGGGLITRPEEDLFPPNKFSEISFNPPSSNISIVVPTSNTLLGIMPNRNNLQPNSEIDDYSCLSRTVSCLKESGWFHEGLSWNDSEALLTSSKSGTFVVRESLNSNYLFAITVQTPQKEPTSVRVQYNNRKFRLDCVSQVTRIVPQFSCVVELIEYYVIGKHRSALANRSNNSLTNQVFVDEHGKFNSVVLLRKPLRSCVPSLMHCARLSINKQLRENNHHLSDKLDQLNLPKSLKRYLFDYPYVI